MNLDRFSHGRPDPIDVPSIAACCVCGKSFYSGDVVYEVEDGDIVCITGDCLETYLGLEITVL